jgi:hypothetical protein
LAKKFFGQARKGGGRIGPSKLAAGPTGAIGKRLCASRKGAVPGLYGAGGRRHKPRAGQMAEWLKAHAWNACIRASVSRVRIPLCPPDYNKNFNKIKKM